jgi:hypothetical protein
MRLIVPKYDSDYFKVPKVVEKKQGVGIRQLAFYNKK